MGVGWLVVCVFLAALVAHIATIAAPLLFPSSSAIRARRVLCATFVVVGAAVQTVSAVAGARLGDPPAASAPATPSSPRGADAGAPAASPGGVAPATTAQAPVADPPGVRAVPSAGDRPLRILVRTGPGTFDVTGDPQGPSTFVGRADGGDRASANGATPPPSTFVVEPSFLASFR